MTPAEVYRQAARIVDQSRGSRNRYACYAIYRAQGEICHYEENFSNWLVGRFHSILAPHWALPGDKWYADYERPACPVIALLLMAEMVETGDA